MTSSDPHRQQFDSRLEVLDGWRGVSIALVLAGHLLPLGPKAWQLNSTAGPAGMALFFVLSGFLITHFLMQRADVVDFLLRRIVRIVPLAWPCMLIGLWQAGAGGELLAPHVLFYANLPPIRLTEMTSHFWSLCVEMQFYAGAAILVALFARRGLLLLPWLCLLVTAIRVADAEEISIVTWYRVDEILAGATVALVHSGRLGERARRWLAAANPYLLLALLLASCHPASGPANYLRPYFAAMLVAATLLGGPTRLARALHANALRYLAQLSYALYVIHPLLAHTWLGAGEGLEKYVKRPLLFAAIFALAHASSFHYESRWIALGKRLSARLAPRRAVGAG
jgi:peptidoglycan/LPS O-acetylase OafA/YrhL